MELERIILRICYTSAGGTCPSFDTVQAIVSACVNQLKQDPNLLSIACT